MSSKVPKIETEVVREIYNNEFGYKHVVRPDPDGLGCITVAYVENGRVSDNSMTFDPATAREVAVAMLACACELEQKNQLPIP